MDITLGRRLKQLVREKGIEQQEVAAELGMKTSTFNSYVADYREPPIYKLKKIAGYFDVSIDYLTGYTERRNLYPSHLPEECKAFINDPENLTHIKLAIDIKERTIAAYKKNMSVK